MSPGACSALVIVSITIMIRIRFGPSISSPTSRVAEPIVPSLCARCTMADVLLEAGSQEVERDVLLGPFSGGAAPRPAAGIWRRRLGACCPVALALVFVSQLVLAARPGSC